MKLIEQVLYDEQKRCNYMEVLNNKGSLTYLEKIESYHALTNSISINSFPKL
jgi:hypothetical protein